MARILLIEDSPTDTAVLTQLLERNGHQVLASGSAEDGIETCRREKPDLVMMDIVLPGMNGFELYQALHDQVPELAARLIFITGDTLTAATQARLAQIGNPYLAKPFAIDRLETTVQGVLSQYRLGPAGT